MSELIATQDGLPMAVGSVLQPDELMLEAFHGVEGISRLFSFELDMLSHRSDVPAAKVLGTPMVIRLDLPGELVRYVHGIVNRFTLGDVEREYSRYHAEIVPWPSLLTHSYQSRIFQEMTALEIVEQVFTDLGFSDFDIACTRPYPQRQYCVQYRETDWNFVSRLLEEEGIWYYFKHMEDSHLLVLGDDNESFPNVKGEDFLFAPHGVREETDVVQRLVQQHAIHSGVVSLKAYDYLQPSLNLGVTLEGEPEVDSLTSLEHYEYVGEYAPGTQSTRDEGDRQARLRLEAKEVRYQTAEGKSDVRALESGYVFGLRGHPSGHHNRDYLLHTVRHFARNGGVISGEGGSFSYRNEFLCLPDDIPFRPPMRAPVPVVHGHQTAVVVGPKDEEVWTDEYGRVKVQFHWDRFGEWDENSSCWLRVATMWAGQSYGSVWIPRIGHEVVIAFLEGDPDRPLIVGAVYNDENRSAYALPDDQVKGGIKTRSSKGGGGHNEIAFDDKKDEEQVRIHAQKDLSETVGNNRTESVGNDETVTVGNDQKVTVKNDQRVTVQEGNAELFVDVASRRVIVEDQYYRLSKTVYEEGTEKIESKVGDQLATTDTGKIELKATDASKHTITSSKIESKVGAGEASVEDGTVTLKVGGATVTVTSSQIELALSGNTVTVTSSGVDVSGSGSVTVSAPQITLN